MDGHYDCHPPSETTPFDFLLKKRLSLLPELLLLVCAHAAQPRALAARAACVCHAWCHALRGNFFTCMPLLLPHVAPGDVASMSAACRSLSHMFARARARMRAKAMQLQAKHMLDAWLDVRVGVPWDADGAGTVYSGTVIGVRSGGQCLRVELDVAAGKAGSADAYDSCR